MSNKTSAAKRARSSARKALHNRSMKSRLKTLEKGLVALVSAGKLEDARGAFRQVASAYDRAAKTGVIKREMARRKRSRLQLRINAQSAKPAA